MQRDLKNSLAAASPTPLAKWLASMGLLGIALAVGGCGQKGALYLQPAASAAPAAPAAAASAPAR